MKNKLSVALATYNEEYNIAQCLKAVKDLADEIIVVDGSSNDDTRELAEKHGAQVYKTTNKPIFHKNKQMAIDKCQYKWILQLDADEIVSDQLKAEIKDLLNNPITEVDSDAFYLPRKNYLLGKWLKKTGQYPDPVIRLFKKGKAHLPCKSVHEQMSVKGKVGHLHGHLLHYPYPSFAEYLKKSNRYTDLEAQKLRESDLKPNLWQLVITYFKAEKTFWQLFIRHKGFVDGFPGFVFSLYSGLHHLTSYVKFWELYKRDNQES